MSTEKPEYPHIVSSRKLKLLKSKVQTGLFTPSLLRKLANKISLCGLIFFGDIFLLHCEPILLFFLKDHCSF